MRPLALLVSLTATGCWASHGRDRDAHRTDAEARCTFTFRVDDGTIHRCEIEHEDMACADAARCFCLAWLGAPTDAELAECIRAEQTPRALVTLSDFCGRELALDAAVASRLGTDLDRVEPRCAEISAHF